MLNDEYEAFDAEGRRILLVADENGAPKGQDGIMEIDTARALILSYYSTVSESFRPDMSLSELVSCLCKVYAYRA